MKGVLIILLEVVIIWTAVGTAAYLGREAGQLKGYGTGLLDGWDMAVTQCRADFQKCETVQQKGWRE